MLQAVGGGNPIFQKLQKQQKPRTKHKGVHISTPGKDEHNRIISWGVLMPSPIAHCKQSVVLLVVALFLLGCVVPSSLGSAVDIRRQNEENNDLSKHSTAEKRKKSGWTVCPSPYQHCCRLPIPVIEPDPRCTIQPLEYWLPLAVDCSGMGLVFWSDIFSQKDPTQFSLCCSMLRHASKPPPTGPKNRCCGMLRQASTVGANTTARQQLWSCFLSHGSCLEPKLDLPHKEESAPSSSAGGH